MAKKKETYGGADALSVFFPEGSAADPEEVKEDQEQESAADPEPAEQPAALSNYEKDGKEKRTQRVNLVLQPSLYKLIKKQAKADKISVNELAIKAFVQYLEKAEKVKK